MSIMPGCAKLQFFLIPWGKRRKSRRPLGVSACLERPHQRCGDCSCGRSHLQRLAAAVISE